MTEQESLRHQVDRALRMHTHSGEFVLSSGRVSNQYVDARAAMIEYPEVFRKFFQTEIDRLGGFEIAGTGVSGALIIQTVGHGFLWNPKGHGMEWSPSPPQGMHVIVVDDIVTTGGTLQRLHDACTKAGLKVEGRVVLRDTTPENTPLIYVASPYSASDEVTEAGRFLSAEKFCALAYNMGFQVISPIVHCHGIALKFEMPKDWGFWQRIALTLLSRSQELWVLKLNGWEGSTGVLAEIQWATEHGIPVRYVSDPVGPGGLEFLKARAARDR